VTLTVTGLSVHYGRATALLDVSFVAPAGAATAILGHNGAGKSSLLRAIAGMVAASRGSVAWDGDPIPASAHRVANRWLRFVPESGNVFGELSVEENLRTGVLTLGRRERAERIDWVLSEFALLRPLRRQRAGQLSGGQRQSLAVARAVVAQPRLLLLDEPTLGLSPKAAAELLSILAQLTSDLQMTVLLAEQNVSAALGICDSGWWLDAGRLMARVNGEATTRPNENMIHVNATERTSLEDR
jgi:branched-chain amino acid transport system ATP-binding protein